MVDCPTGLAGDMLFKACLDLGRRGAVLRSPSLPWASMVPIAWWWRRAATWDCADCNSMEAVAPQTEHRHWRDLRRQIDQAPLDAVLKQRVLAVFSALAEAEAAVHGTSLIRCTSTKWERSTAWWMWWGCVRPSRPWHRVASLSRSASRSWHGADRAWLPARARSCRFGIGTALSGPPAVRSRSAQWRTDHAHGIGPMAVLADGTKSPVIWWWRALASAWGISSTVRIC